MSELFVQAKESDAEELAPCIASLWHSAYDGLLGPAQVDYMTGKFQSAAEIRRQIAEYKKYADLVQKGTYYRLTNPQTDNQGAWEFVSGDQKEALVQVVGIKKHANMTVDYIKVKGLKENTMYREETTGKLYNSTALREAGVPKPVLHGEYQAYQWHFVEEDQ